MIELKFDKKQHQHLDSLSLKHPCFFTYFTLPDKSLSVFRKFHDKKKRLSFSLLLSIHVLLFLLKKQFLCHLYYDEGTLLPSLFNRESLNFCVCVCPVSCVWCVVSNNRIDDRNDNEKREGIEKENTKRGQSRKQINLNLRDKKELRSEKKEREKIQREIRSATNSFLIFSLRQQHEQWNSL